MSGDDSVIRSIVAMLLVALTLFLSGVSEYLKGTLPLAGRSSNREGGKLRILLGSCMTIGSLFFLPLNRHSLFEFVFSPLFRLVNPHTHPLLQFALIAMSVIVICLFPLIIGHIMGVRIEWRINESMESVKVNYRKEGLKVLSTWREEEKKLFWSCGFLEQFAGILGTFGALIEGFNVYPSIVSWILFVLACNIAVLIGLRGWNLISLWMAWRKNKA